MRTSKAAVTTAADAVGAVSTVLGSLLVLTPNTAARQLRLPGSRENRHRALGAADLGLGIAILVGRSAQWRWIAVAARSLLHLVFAREYFRGGNRVGAGAMGMLFVIDAGIANGLRETNRTV
ncbi:hypothetical protein GCM10011490_08070 [Pseudoclavibacter endophyticus]|uniref:DUF4267 domain-containing protein n=1 Tax=Pseudoclavibacter endophyticus TaxID=1778590 RepID=A0A6H9WPN9_9MICO|nr:hypothetical protein [Pseudoclavibacter endophyticus]KAB1649721.1 hypothetical protein F8O04_05650 [Pseudoclavibacter endophyticus]GGA60276.1 hypothetical protein GCM10011490_08070 [Pseudoclavibacter endophyticus]